jgi:hypothetical protein
MYICSDVVLACSEVAWQQAMHTAMHTAIHTAMHTAIHTAMHTAIHIAIHTYSHTYRECCTYNALGLRLVCLLLRFPQSLTLALLQITLALRGQ